jgi:ketosteroid isomerase-like protein
LKQLIAEGDFVVAVVETRGRIVGDYYGVPGQGKPFTNKGAVVYGFQDGKIASVDPYFDDLKIVTEQLGATLVPAQPAG